VRSLPFTVLVALCFAVLLGLRFALEPLAARVAAVVSPEQPGGEATLAVPPKPEGLEPKGEGTDGGGGALLSREACERMGDAVRATCFQALARQSAARDPQGALQVCALIEDEDLRWECHADVAEAVAPVDRVAAEAICVAIPRVKWRGQCHFGMGLALAELDPADALGRCEQAEIFRDFCRHDVVGEVALVDLEPAVAFCAREQGDALTRKTCWHGIGKYLARRDAQEAATACGRATDAWRGNCFHGVGWGAAERDADAALAACGTFVGYVDNCRQGVAHQLKRFDPSRAVSLCESIGTDTIRARCLSFVTR
jgi:hypothetical protein